VDDSIHLNLPGLHRRQPAPARVTREDDRVNCG